MANGHVVIEHLLSTNLMHANVLNKPVHCAQFETERTGLANWALALESVRVFPENFSLEIFKFISQSSSRK